MTPEPYDIKKRYRNAVSQIIFLLYTLKPCNQLRIINQCTLPLQLTPPGTLTAHTKSTLVLLHSCPDTVRRHILRETQTSSPLIEGGYINADPLPIITPTIADCRYKAPLTPRLHGISSIQFSVLLVNQKYFLIFLTFFHSQLKLFLFISLSEFNKKLFQHLTAFPFQNASYNIDLMIKLWHFQNI